MYPTLFKIGPIPIHSYGFLIAIGFLVAVQVIKRLAIRSKLSVEKLLDLTFWGLLVGFAGARILFVITRFSHFMDDPIAIFRVWEGGLVFLGAPPAVILFLVFYMRKHKLPVWRSLDAMIPGVVIAHAFGRMGCLAAGCCYGRPTDLPWGITFHSGLVDEALRGLPLHPTQLYESLALTVLFFGLLAVFKNKKFDGQVIITYFMAYPILRSLIEIFRGDLIRGFVIDGVLSTSQFISILIFAAATVALTLRLKQVRQREVTA